MFQATRNCENTPFLGAQASLNSHLRAIKTSITTAQPSVAGSVYRIGLNASIRSLTKPSSGPIVSKLRTQLQQKVPQAESAAASHQAPTTAVHAHAQAHASNSTQSHGYHHDRNSHASSNEASHDVKKVKVDLAEDVYDQPAPPTLSSTHARRNSRAFKSVPENATSGNQASTEPLGEINFDTNIGSTNERRKSRRLSQSHTPRRSQNALHQQELASKATTTTVPPVTPHRSTLTSPARRGSMTTRRVSGVAPTPSPAHLEIPSPSSSDYAQSIGIGRRRSMRVAAGNQTDDIPSVASPQPPHSPSDMMATPEIEQRVKRPRRSSLSQLSAGLSELGFESRPISAQARAREALLERKQRIRGVPSPNSVNRQRREQQLKDACRRARMMRTQALQQATEQMEEAILAREREEAEEAAYLAEQQRRAEEEALKRLAEEHERLRQELARQEAEKREREAELARAHEALAQMTAMFEAASAAAAATANNANASHASASHASAPAFDSSSTMPAATPFKASTSKASHQSGRHTRTRSRASFGQQTTQAPAPAPAPAPEPMQTQMPEPAAASESASQSQTQPKRFNDIKIPMAMRGLGRKREPQTNTSGASVSSDQMNTSSNSETMPPCTPHKKSTRAHNTSDTDNMFASESAAPATPVRGTRSVFENLMTARKTTVTRKRHQSAISPTQARRKAEEEMRERELQARIAQRHEEIKAKAASAKMEDDQRARLRDQIQPKIHRMTARMSAVDLLNEFYPRCRLGQYPDKDTLRRNMRRAMAQYHPDKTVGLSLAQQVEAEVVFSVLQRAYEVLDAACNA